MAFAKIPVIDRSRRTGANKPVPIWQEQTPRTTGRQNRMFDEAMRQNVALEADPFNICILNYTMTCPLACDYCCYTCGPKRTETMDFNFAMGVVDQAIQLGEGLLWSCPCRLGGICWDEPKRLRRSQQADNLINAQIDQLFTGRLLLPPFARRNYAFRNSDFCPSHLATCRSAAWGW